MSNAQGASRLFSSTMLVALLLVSPGCGRLELEHLDPLAAGATHSYGIRYHDSAGWAHDVALSVRSAVAADPGVLEVLETEGEEVVLKGLREGETTLSVEVLLNGEDEFSDTLSVRVVEPARISLSACGSSHPDLLEGSVVQVQQEMFASSGERLFGTGYAPWSADPPQALREHDDHVLTLASWHGPLTISSDLDHASIMQAKVVSAGEIDGVKTAAPFAANADFFVQASDEQQSPPTLHAGMSSRLDLVSTVAGQPLCQAQPVVQVTNNSAASCSVTIVPPETAAGCSGVCVDVRALNPGTCAFELELPDALHGAGIRTAYEIEVVEAYWK